jgi:ABC-type transporter Mla MlaB component
MTWRIERVSAQGRTILRLSGRIQSEYLAELKTQIEGSEPHSALDLEEVTLVDVGVVRFLLVCEESGIELLHCSPYIRQWMVRERPGRSP